MVFHYAVINPFNVLGLLKIKSKAADRVNFKKGNQTCHFQRRAYLLNQDPYIN